jgi:hypothetical protein
VHWVIQSNIYEEVGYQAVLDHLDRLGLKKTLVKVVPFEGRLEPTEGELPADGAAAIVLGSYTLAKVARQKNWRPGAFLQNLDFEVQRQHWGENMLNYDAVICKFDSVSPQIKPFFIRPVHDTKAFTGFVCDWPYYSDWRDSMRRLPETADPVNDPLGVNLMTLDTPVMVCSKKEIDAEYRTWIVNRKVITVSGAKVGTRVRYLEPHLVDARITEFSQRMADIWVPDEALVLDVADTPLGLKITEINNINSAGFYKGDMQKLIMALEDHCVG